MSMAHMTLWSHVGPQDLLESLESFMTYRRPKFPSEDFGSPVKDQESRPEGAEWEPILNFF